MVGSALGAFAAGAFSLWASRQHMYPPLIAALGIIITGTVVIITNIAVNVLARIDLKTVSGWVALAFVVWWVMEQPADAQHLVANIGGFLSMSAKGLVTFVSSI